MFTHTLLGVTALISTATAPISDTETANWRSWSYVGGEIVDAGDSDVIGLSTASADQPGISFICDANRGLTAVVSMQAADMVEQIPDATRRAKRRTVTLSLEGDEVAREEWAYSPVAKTSVPLRESLSKKLYNAAVQGQTIEVDMSSKGQVTILPPTIDSNFKQFASACHVTNPSAKG